MSEILLTKKNHGGMVNSNIGDLVVIRLEENITTGYQWELEKTENLVLDLVDSTYSSDSGELLGRGGIRTFRFRSTSSGSENIRLRLRRSWESEELSIDNFEVKIKVL